LRGSEKEGKLGIREREREEVKEGLRNFHIKEVYNLYSSPNIIRVIKSTSV